MTPCAPDSPPHTHTHLTPTLFATVVQAIIDEFRSDQELDRMQGGGNDGDMRKGASARKPLSASLSLSRALSLSLSLFLSQQLQCSVHNSRLRMLY